jgi:hypothetical protein
LLVVVKGGFAGLDKAPAETGSDTGQGQSRDKAGIGQGQKQTEIVVKKS